MANDGGHDDGTAGDTRRVERGPAPVERLTGIADRLPARTIGAVMVLIGLLGVAGWVWNQLRVQGVLPGDGFIGVGGIDHDLTTRVDLFIGSLTMLMQAALLVGLGVLVARLGDRPAPTRH